MQLPMLVIWGREIQFPPPVPRTEPELELYVRNICGNMVPSTVSLSASPSPYITQTEGGQQAEAAALKAEAEALINLFASTWQQTDTIRMEHFWSRLAQPVLRRFFPPAPIPQLDRRQFSSSKCPVPPRRRMRPAMITLHNEHFQRTFLKHIRA